MAANCTTDYFALAEHYWEQSQPEAAYDALCSAVAEDDTNYEARAFRLHVGQSLKRREIDHENDRDAHRLLALRPNAGLAYLYLGQSMVTQGKHANAIDWLDKAHKRVAADDPHRYKIREMLEMLRKTEINFLIRLPPDILCLVFSYLPFASRLHCAAVSRTWRLVLTTTSILWRDLDLSCDADVNSVVVALERSVEWAGGATRRVRVALSEEVLWALTRQGFHYLRHVDFTHPGRRMVDERLLIQAMQTIAAPWCHVAVSGRTIPLGTFTAGLCLYCPRITTLIIQRGVLIDTFDDNETDAITMDSLRTLILLESYDTEASDIQNLLGMCPNIVTLKIDACVAFESRKTWKQISQLTQLQYLSLTSSESDLIHAAGFIHFISKHPLKSLDLNRCELEKDTLDELADVMARGILRWGGSSYAMDDPENRKRLQADLSELEDTDTDD